MLLVVLAIQARYYSILKDRLGRIVSWYSVVVIFLSVAGAMATLAGFIHDLAWVRGLILGAILGELISISALIRSYTRDDHRAN